MLCVNQKKFIWESAASWYGEGKMDSYLVADNKLVFYSLVNQTPDTVSALKMYVENRIKAPFVDHIYDWAGIVGEAIGIPKFHTPGLEYCSVDNIHALKTIAYTLPQADQKIIYNIPNEENPGYLDNVMVNSPKVFKLYGIYQYGIKPS